MDTTGRSIMASVDVTTLGPIERPEATVLAEAEVARMVDALRALGPDDWALPTACDLWDVRAMAGHVLGMTETFTGIWTMARTMRAGGRPPATARSWTVSPRCRSAMPLG